MEGVVEVAESPSSWGMDREMESGGGNSEVEAAIVVDFTQEFDRIFVQTTFNSFSEFEALFNKFKAETGTVFRIKSSCSVEYENARRKKHFIPARFKFVSVRYCCVHYGQPKIAGQGIRTKQRYLPCGCECLLSLSYNRGALVISQATMQHNHEVSSQMAPYYAINRRISNNELRQVADMIELLPNSRAVQQFLQKHFHRPTTLQDAKNIRARLKTLKMHQEESSRAIRYIRPESLVEEEGDREEVTKEEEEVLEDIREIHEDVDDEREEDVEVSDPCGELLQEAQEQLREAVLEKIKEKLYDLLIGCKTPVFLNRVGIISKIIESWENGDHFEVQYAVKNNCVIQIGDKGSGHIKLTTQTQGNPQTCNKSTVANHLPENCSSSVQLLPSSLNGQSLRLILPHRDGIVSNTQVTRSKGLHRTKKCVIDELKLEYRDQDRSQIHHPVKVHQKIIEDGVHLCDEAMEVEIEVNGSVANVKRVRFEPLEYCEVDIT